MSNLFYIILVQFGLTLNNQFSPDDKKLMTKKFKETLISINQKSMEEQKEYLDSFIENWKGGTEQTDDILVIGIRV